MQGQLTTDILKDDALQDEMDEIDIDDTDKMMQDAAGGTSSEMSSNPLTVMNEDTEGVRTFKI